MSYSQLSSAFHTTEFSINIVDANITNITINSSKISPRKFTLYHAVKYVFRNNSLHGLPQQLYFEISKETVPHALICICSFPYAICLLDKWRCAIMGNHRSGKLAAKQWLLKGCVRVVLIDCTNK